MLEKLMNNPIAWLILSLISVVSFVFGIYTWVAGKKKKEISISQESYELIRAGKKQIPKLDVIYDGVNVDNLTVTSIYIWNSGNDVINTSDIVHTKKFTISSCENTNILDAYIIREVDESNKFRIVSMDRNRMTIDFDYIDQGEGCLVQLFHTGSSQALCFDCKIKGGKKIRHCYENDGQTVPVVSNISYVFKKISELIPILLAIGSCAIAPKVIQILGYEIDHGPSLRISSLIAMLIGAAIGFFSQLLPKKYGQMSHKDVPNVLKRKR